MPRQARIDAPGSVHHIMIRGIEKCDIFRDDADRDDFLTRLEGILIQTSTACYAWALIPNHAHLLLRTGKEPLASVMRRLLTGYAVHFNRRHKRHGHLFQNRYKSILCQEDPYLRELVRYIHLNPLRAQLVPDLATLDSYPYAGHGALMGKRKNDWQDIDYILSFFGRTQSVARKRYREYVGEGIALGKRPDLAGGGLIRSSGGWAKAKELLKGRQRSRGDERILGDSDFVAAAIKAADDQLDRSYSLKAQGYDFGRLVGQVADIMDLEPEQITAPGKYPKAVEARSLLCYWAVRELGMTATEVARNIGLTQPAVSIAVRRGEALAVERGLGLPC